MTAEDDVRGRAQARDDGLRRVTTWTTALVVSGVVGSGVFALAAHADTQAGRGTGAGTTTTAVDPQAGSTQTDDGLAVPQQPPTRGFGGGNLAGTSGGS